MLVITEPMNAAGIGVTTAMRLDRRGPVARCGAPTSHRRYCALRYRITETVILIIDPFRIDYKMTSYFYLQFNHNVHARRLNKILKLILYTNIGLYKDLSIQLTVDNRKLGTRQPKTTGARVARHLWRR